MIDAPWTAELKRLESLWTQGRRQLLTLGLGAYGLLLGLSFERVERDMLALCERCGDAELEKRRTALWSTRTRRDLGKTIGFATWYEQAGVEPPPYGRDAAVLEDLEAMAQHNVLQPHWKGTGGKTDVSVYAMLLSCAFRYGVAHPLGVEISVDRISIEHESNVGSPSTIQNALVRLEGESLVAGGEISRGTRSASLVLLRPLQPASPEIAVLANVISFYKQAPHLRYGKSLGKTVEQVLLLLYVFGPQTEHTLAGRAGIKRVYDLRKRYLQKMRAIKVIEPTDLEGDIVVWNLTEDWAEGVKDACEDDGTDDARFSQGERNAAKRLGWKRHCAEQAEEERRRST